MEELGSWRYHNTANEQYEVDPTRGQGNGVQGQRPVRLHKLSASLRAKELGRSSENGCPAHRTCSNRASRTVQLLNVFRQLSVGSSPYKKILGARTDLEQI